MSQNEGARPLHLSFEDAGTGARLERSCRIRRRGTRSDGRIRHTGGGIVAMAVRGERSDRDRGLSAGSLPDNPKSGSFDLTSTLLNASMFGFGFIGIDLLTRGDNVWIGTLH
jgi:hypothetical protein